MGNLTDTKLKAIKDTGKAQRHSDGEGLYLYVSKSGGKLWRMDYTNAEGKRKVLSLGKYPAVSLKKAREKRFEAAQLIADGIDPTTQRKALKAALRTDFANSFEVVAREWHENNKHTWTKKHQETVIDRLKNNIFPFLGKTDVKKITPPEMLTVLRKIESREAYETTHRVLGICSQVFRYAIATSRAESDPCRDLRGALIPVKHKSLASLKKPEDVGNYLQIADEYVGNMVVRLALQITPYVFVRPSELRCAKWSEFNFDKQEWLIPAERMKKRLEHLVPLSTQVMKYLEELRCYTGHTEYLFPSMRTNTAPISDATLLAGLRRMGYSKEELCVHGFRHTASTMLNEIGFNRDHIERQLAHVENSVRETYNKALYLPHRRKMMQEWANYLDALRKGESYECDTTGN